MATQLVDLANEIIESIVVLLDLPDICNLRLASRLLASKVTQDHFRSFFRSQKIDLTKQSLQAFVDATRSGRLGCLVQDLTLVGIANNPKGLESILQEKTRPVVERNGPMFMSTGERCSEEELVKAERDLHTINRRREEQQQLREHGRDVELLGEAFANIAAHGKSGGLYSLSLEVAMYRDDADEPKRPTSGLGWKYVWQAAADSYKAAMPALAGSGLQVLRLNLFNSEGFIRCSIASNELSILDFEDPGLQTCLRSIKSLSISLSDRIIDETDHDAKRTGDPGDEVDWSIAPKPRAIEELRAEAADEKNFSGLARLVSLCSNLEELDLHFFNMAIRILTSEDAKDEILLQRLADITKGRLTNLKKCRLRGFHVWEQDLLALVQQAPALQSLTLDNMMLTATNDAEGHFQTIFDHCTSEDAELKNMFFDDLFEHGRLVYFDAPGRPKFPSMGGSRGTNTLKREGKKDVRKPISYHFTEGRPLGSPQAYYWRERRRAEYGPP